MKYEIRVDASLDQSWSQWFTGMAIERDSNNRTRLIGHIEDQAALHGVLAQVRDLGLEVISIVRVEPEHQPDNEETS